MLNPNLYFSINQYCPIQNKSSARKREREIFFQFLGFCETETVICVALRQMKSNIMDSNSFSLSVFVNCIFKYNELTRTTEFFADIKSKAQTNKVNSLLDDF